MALSEGELSLRERGVLRMKEGRFVEAAAALRDVVAQDDADLGAWRLLGGALSALEDTAGAVRAFEKTVLLDPSQPKNHYNLALALQAQGDRAGARRHFHHALALDPSYEQANQRLRELDALPMPPVASEQSRRADVPGQDEGTFVATPPRRSPPLPPNYYASAEQDRPAPIAPPVYGAYSAAAPSGYGQGQRQRERPGSAQGQAINGTNILALGILGLAVTPILSPFAWYHGNRALELLDRNPEGDQSQRSNVQAGRLLGIIGTLLLLFAVALLILIGMAGGFR